MPSPLYILPQLYLLCPHRDSYYLEIPLILLQGYQMNFPQHTLLFKAIQSSSVTQWCPTLCDPMDCSMPGLPVRHQLLEFTQAHAH